MMWFPALHFDLKLEKVPGTVDSRSSTARALCDTLRQRLQLIEEAYKAGEASLLEVLTNARELAEAEVAVANSPENRRVARRRQVELLKQLKTAVEALYKANEAGKADVLAVEVELLKAEAQLERGSDPEQEMLSPDQSNSIPVSGKTNSSSEDVVKRPAPSVVAILPSDHRKNIN